MPEAGARHYIHFKKDVIRLLHMVVVSWAGLGWGEPSLSVGRADYSAFSVY